MKKYISDIFMAALVVNAYMDMSDLSYVVFACGAVCLTVRAIQAYKGMAGNG